MTLALAVALAIAAAWPGGPLAFLPAVLRWPLAAAAVAAAAAGPGRRALVIEHAAAALALLTFALLKVPGLHAGWSDENAYFYMAVRVAEGDLPYRDFFFAHPPVHLAIPALAFGLTGFSAIVAQLLPLAAQLLAGTLLWRSARRVSPLLGVAALVLHLTAYQVLMTASDLCGANLATAFAMAALLAAVAGRPALAGALSALSLGTALYAAASVGAVALVSLRRGRGHALRFATGLAVFLAAIAACGWSLGGDAFARGVFGYHLDKAAGEGRAAVLGAPGIAAATSGWLHNLAADLAGPGLVRGLALHAPVLCAAAVGAAVLAAVRLRRANGAPEPAPSPEDLATAAAAGVALSAVQHAALAEVYPYYAVPAFPWLALLGAYGCWRLWHGARRSRPLALWAAAGVVVFALHPALARLATPRAFPEERLRARERVTYAWRDPEVLADLAPLSRALFWKDHRTRGAPEPGYRVALWNKRFTFSTAEAIAAHVRTGSSAGETITGGSTLAPLVALLAGRRLAAGEADTNQKRFASGSLEDDAFLRRALADQVRFVLASPRSHFTEQLLERHPGWSAHFERAAVFDDPWLANAGPVRLVLYRRREP